MAVSESTRLILPRRVWLACVIVLLAFILRVALLDRRPLHFDEGNNVYFGLRATHLLADSIDHAEADPPLHRWFLGGWMALAGTSPLAIRFLSVGWGVLAVALAGRLARMLLRDETQAVGVMLLMALAVFAVDYSQEAKGYALVSAAALASTWAWLRLLKPAGRSAAAFAVYVLASAAMLGTHYFAAPLLGMQWLLLLAERRPIRQWPWLRLLGAQALACAPVALWIGLAWRGIMAGGMRASGTPFGFHPLTLLLGILGEFAAGRYASPTVQPLAGALLGLLWLAGLIALWRRGRRLAFWMGAGFALALAFAEAVAPRLSIFYPRFLLWALPFVLLAVVALLGSTWRGVGLRLLALAGIANVLLFYRSPIDPQTDYRPLFEQVRPLMRAGDAALGTYIWMDGMAASYAPETLPKLTWERDFYQNDGSDIEQRMRPLQSRFERIWHFNFERSPDDPATRSALWLRQHGAEAARWEQGTLSAVLFLPAETPAEVCCAHATFGALVEATWAPPLTQAQAGDAVRVNLRWRALKPMAAEALGISLQLIGSDGHLVVQRDQDALNGLSPTISWPQGQAIADARALLLPADLPAGDYDLRLVVYRREGGARLPTESGADSAEIGHVRVEAASASP